MEKVSKLIVRLSVIFMSLYIIMCAILNITVGVDLWRLPYFILLELCVCLCMSAQGKFHCKYIKFTAWSIFFTDLFTTIDNYFLIFGDLIHVIIALCISISGISISTILAFLHYRKVRQIRNRIKYAKAINTVA